MPRDARIETCLDGCRVRGWKVARRRTRRTQPRHAPPSEWHAVPEKKANDPIDSRRACARSRESTSKIPSLTNLRRVHQSATPPLLERTVEIHPRFLSRQPLVPSSPTCIPLTIALACSSRSPPNARFCSHQSGREGRLPSRGPWPASGAANQTFGSSCLSTTLRCKKKKNRRNKCAPQEEAKACKRRYAETDAQKDDPAAIGRARERTRARNENGGREREGRRRSARSERRGERRGAGDGCRRRRARCDARRRRCAGREKRLRKMRARKNKAAAKRCGEVRLRDRGRARRARGGDARPRPRPRAGGRERRTERARSPAPPPARARGRRDAVGNPIHPPAPRRGRARHGVVCRFRRFNAVEGRRGVAADCRPGPEAERDSSAALALSRPLLAPIAPDRGTTSRTGAAGRRDPRAGRRERREMSAGPSCRERPGGRRVTRRRARFCFRSVFSALVLSIASRCPFTPRVLSPFAVGSVSISHWRSEARAETVVSERPLEPREEACGAGAVP